MNEKIKKYIRKLIKTKAKIGIDVKEYEEKSESLSRQGMHTKGYLVGVEDTLEGIIYDLENILEKHSDDKIVK